VAFVVDHPRQQKHHRTGEHRCHADQQRGDHHVVPEQCPDDGLPTIHSVTLHAPRLALHPSGRRPFSLALSILTKNAGTAHGS